MRLDLMPAHFQGKRIPEQNAVQDEDLTKRARTSSLRKGPVQMTSAIYRTSLSLLGRHTCRASPRLDDQAICSVLYSTCELFPEAGNGRRAACRIYDAISLLRTSCDDLLTTGLAAGLISPGRFLWRQL